jgi:hypothetical protein
MCTANHQRKWRHTWGKWTASATDYGYLINQRTCFRCGYTQTRNS